LIQIIPSSKKSKNKPKIVSSVEELSNPLFGLNEIIDENSTVLILGTFPAQESIDQNFYYQNQIKRFWGQALSTIGSFEMISNQDREKLLLEKKIGLWDIFECVERIKSNQDSAIKKAKYNDIEKLLNLHPSVQYLVFNGKNAYEWLFEDNPGIFSIKNVHCVRLQSSSGSNGHFHEGKDWNDFFNSLLTIKN